MNNKQDLEKKWQERWESNLSFNTSKKPDEKKPKYYGINSPVQDGRLRSHFHGYKMSNLLR